MGISDSNIKLLIEHALHDSDEQVGPACVNVKVPPTIVMTEDFREPYVQGYRHALSDVRKYLKPAQPEAIEQAKARYTRNEGTLDDLAEAIIRATLR